MKEELSKLILENPPSALIIFCAVLVAFCVAVWWAAKIWFKIKNLPCEKHAHELSKHTDKISDVVSSLARIEGQLHILVGAYTSRSSNSVENIFSSDAPQVSQKNSPKVLNNNGKTIEKLFGCAEFLADNAEWLMTQVDKFSPKTALDVEMYSLAALRISSTDERFNEIKNKIYHSPAIPLETVDGMKPFEIRLDDVLYVISLPLRDLYLSNHPEIKV